MKANQTKVVRGFKEFKEYKEYEENEEVKKRVGVVGGARLRKDRKGRLRAK
jgi:hypothetical protein